MQTAETQRLTYFQSPSSVDGSILINQGLTSDSSRASTLTSVASSMSLNKNVQKYQRPSTAMTSAAQITHWNMQSRRLSLQHQNANMPRESTRDGLHELAVFLMTNEPPPSSWMSYRSDEDRSTHSLNTSSIKIFARRKRKSKKKSHNHKLLQLPDSAVSAKTSSGVRHIAISIPIEYDHVEEGSAQNQPPSTQRPQPQRIVSEKGAVTVLKPVIELKESVSSSLISRGRGEMASGTGPLESRQAPPPAKFIEAAPTLKTENSPLAQLDRVKSTEGKGLAPRRNVPVNALTLDRTDSQRSNDPRHSGGSAYSNATITSQNWLSRGPSNASISSPPRSSSKVNFPKTLGPADFIQIGGLDALMNIQTPEDQPQLRTPIKSSFDGELSEQGSPSLPTVFSTGTAKIIRSYSAHGVRGGPRLIGNMTSATPAGPAPTRGLPEIPNHGARPSSAPLSHTRSFSTQALQSIAEKEKRSAKPRPTSPQDAQQTRKEQVRAKKRSDIEKLRAQRSAASLRSLSIISNESSEDCVPTPTLTSVITEDFIPPPPPQNPEKPLSKPELSLSCMTSIMIVADLEPILELPSSPKRRSSSISTATLFPIDKPPKNSREFLSEGDSDTLPASRRRSNQSIIAVTPKSATPSIAGSDLQSRRRERKVKRNVGAREREREMNARLEKVERDNQRLIEALSGIARGIGELGTLGLGRKFGFEDTRGMAEVR